MGSVVFSDGISVAHRLRIDHSQRLEPFRRMSVEFERTVEQKSSKSIKFQTFDHLPLFSDFSFLVGTRVVLQTRFR
jgi:hypothetical protein